MPDKTIWITPVILAAALGLHRDTIVRYVHIGKLPPFDVNMGRRCSRWRLETITALPQISPLIVEYLEQHTASPEKPA